MESNQLEMSVVPIINVGYTKTHEDGNSVEFVQCPLFVARLEYQGQRKLVFLNYAFVPSIEEEPLRLPEPGDEYATNVALLRALAFADGTEMPAKAMAMQPKKFKCLQQMTPDVFARFRQAFASLLWQADDMSGVLMLLPTSGDVDRDKGFWYESIGVHKHGEPNPKMPLARLQTFGAALVAKSNYTMLNNSECDRFLDSIAEQLGFRPNEATEDAPVIH